VDALGSGPKGSKKTMLLLVCVILVLRRLVYPCAACECYLCKCKTETVRHSVDHSDSKATNSPFCTSCLHSQKLYLSNRTVEPIVCSDCVSKVNEHLQRVNTRTTYYLVRHSLNNQFSFSNSYYKLALDLTYLIYIVYFMLVRPTLKTWAFLFAVPSLFDWNHWRILLFCALYLSSPDVFALLQNSFGHVLFPVIHSYGTDSTCCLAILLYNHIDSLVVIYQPMVLRLLQPRKFKHVPVKSNEIVILLNLGY
jgi:hypothetical protein